MQLQELEIIPVRCHAHHREAKPWDGVLVKLRTDTGITGIGETSAQTNYLGDTGPHIVKMLEWFWDRLKGMNPTNVGGIHGAMSTPYSGYNAAQVAIDMAVYDILGKATGLPLYEYLDGENNTELEMLGHVDSGFLYGSLDNIPSDLPPFAGVDVPPMDENEDVFEEAMRQVRDYLDRGYRGIKVKIGGAPTSQREIEERLDFLSRVMDYAGDDVEIKADVNERWNASDVVKAFGRNFEDAYNLTLEQPTPYDKFEELADIRTALDVPISADESAYSPEAVLRIAKMRAADQIDIKMRRVGGIYPAMQMISIAEAAGMDVAMDLSVYSKISDTVRAHVTAQLSDAYPVPLDGFEWFEERPFSETGLTYRDGLAHLPEEPGIGVEVSEREVESLRTDEPRRVLD